MPKPRPWKLPFCLGVVLILGMRSGPAISGNPPAAPAGFKNPLAGCLQCHVNVEKPYLKSRHFTKKVGCTDCHGASKGHLANENNEVKPDEVFARKDVDRLCSQCHPCKRTIATSETSLPASQRQVCTQCHRAHDFAVLTGGVPPEDLEKIRRAAPHEAPARPKKTRKVLVFSKADGFVHDSIPWGAAAFRILGEKTGAYTATLSDDPAMFDRERLFQFDAVVMNNNCGNPIADSRRRANLLEFVRGGRGLIGIHCAAHLDWPEYTEMLGGYSISHPWNAGSTVTIKLDEPDHPLVKCFGKTSFPHTDEIFVFRDCSRRNVRVLLSLDTTKTDMNRPGIAKKNGDYPLSWIRDYGRGRVFYCALGHQKDVYGRPSILKHYLAGIQFALGDLPASAKP